MKCLHEDQWAVFKISEREQPALASADKETPQQECAINDERTSLNQHTNVLVETDLEFWTNDPILPEFSVLFK